MTVSFQPAATSALATLAETLGGILRVLLRDTEPESGPQPVERPDSPELPPPEDRLGKYQMFGEIARGGMGAVLKARDPDLGRELALKVLLERHRDRPELVRRFLEEAQIGGQLQHPGIVPVYDLGTFGDRRPFFAMKLVKGRTWAELLAGRTATVDDLPRHLGIFEQVAQTVAYAHARGVIHRDLKPSNVMVGSFGEVQVMDWGLAKVLPRGGVADEPSGPAEPAETAVATARSGSGSDASHAGSVMGTPAYMPPEQARGEVDRIDERADVFALGSILCEVLTGRPAYTGGSLAEVVRHAAAADLADAAARIDACAADAELVALARSCLAPAPEARPRDARAVAEAVTAYLAGVQQRLKAAELARVEAQARAEEERKRRRLAVGLAATVLLSVGLGVGGWTWAESRRIATERRFDLALADATTRLGVARASHDDAALRRLAEPATVDRLGPATVALLASSLADGRDRDGAIALLRRGLLRHPRDARLNEQIASYLERQSPEGRAEAISYYRVARALQPATGHELADRGPDEAEAIFRELAEARATPSGRSRHLGCLGRFLSGRGRSAEAAPLLERAVAASRAALRLRPDDPGAHYYLGNALLALGRQAEAASRAALRLRPDFPEAHCKLGQLLRDAGRYDEALAELRRGHELGSKRLGWRYPSADWVRLAERMVALAGRLPAALRGEDRPDPADGINLALMAQGRRLYAAARLFADALAADPMLADDRQAQHRYNAACCAALAGSGRGDDDPKPDDDARAALRDRALTWLRAERDAWAEVLDSGPAEARPAIAPTLQHWKADADLAGVRDPEALARLPEADRAEWRALWGEVDALLKVAQAPAGSPQKANPSPEARP